MPLPFNSTNYLGEISVAWGPTGNAIKDNQGESAILYVDHADYTWWMLITIGTTSVGGAWAFTIYHTRSPLGYRGPLTIYPNIPRTQYRDGVVYGTFPDMGNPVTYPHAGYTTCTPGVTRFTVVRFEDEEANVFIDGAYWESFGFYGLSIDEFLATAIEGSPWRIVPDGWATGARVGGASAVDYNLHASPRIITSVSAPLWGVPTAFWRRVTNCRTNV